MWSQEAPSGLHCRASVTPGGDHCRGTPKSGTPGAGEGLTGAEGAMSQQPSWWQQLLSPCPAIRTLSQPHMPFPALGDSRVVLGVTCPARAHPASRTSDSQRGAGMGGFAALPSLGKMVSLCPPDPPCPPKPKAGQQAPSCVLQGGPADRQGGDSFAAPSASLSGARHAALGQHPAGRAVAHGTLLWHLGVPTLALWYQPGGHSGPSTTVGYKAIGQGWARVLSRQQGWQAPASMEIIPWG